MTDKKVESDGNMDLVGITLTFHANKKLTISNEETEEIDWDFNGKDIILHGNAETNLENATISNSLLYFGTELIVSGQNQNDEPYEVLARFKNYYE